MAMDVVLWDVDGTLLDAEGAGHRALLKAVQSVTGTAVDLAGVDFSGRTDRALIEEALARANGKPLEEWAKVRDRYGFYLQDELRHGGGLALPGVDDLLSLLAERYPHIAPVLGTGNLEQGAWLKLGRYGLAHHFSCGGFGDRHRTRVPVLKDALAAAVRHWQMPIRNVLVIGDTPRDAEAARSLAVPCLLVATGHHGLPELRNEGPDVLMNLADTEQSVGAILHLLDHKSLALD